MESGLVIKTGPNRGVSYTDPLGTKFNYRYISSTITNGNTFPIDIQIALSNEYDFPAPYGNQTFKVFLLPIELSSDDITFDSVSYELGDNALRDFFDQGLAPPFTISTTLESGEECVIALGTLYPRPTNCGVVPNALFLLNNSDLYPDCDSLINQGVSANPSFALGLKLDFCSGCTLIPLGQISYPER